MFKDRAFGWTMAVGGISVIIAIVMIFFYLFYVVVPMFASARIESVASYQLPYKGSDVVHLAIDEYAEIGLAISSTGNYLFFEADTGASIVHGRIAHSDAHEVVATASGDPALGAAFLAYDDGTVIVVRARYAISYPRDKRHIADWAARL